MPWWKKILKTPGDIFVPILPAIVASGLMMGLVEALPKFIKDFDQTAWYQFLDLVANTAFVCLPVLIAVSAARVFGGNVFLGAVIGFVMIHPSLLNAWNVGSSEAINSFFGVTNGQIQQWKLLGDLTANSKILSFFFDVNRVGYQGHVIPVILAVLLMCKIEKGLHKIVPEVIDLFVTPLVTVLVTVFFTFTVIGPVFSVLENWVLAGAKKLITIGYGVGAGIMGAIYPVTVVMGLHHMYNVIEAGMLSGAEKLNTWMPIASAANFAQFGACLAVAFIAKNKKTKSVALPGSLSASLGITEPAIFGINFRFMKPFIAGMIGGGVGALFGSLFKLGAHAYGVTGIPGIPVINNVPMYLVMLLISAGVAFVLTFILWKEEKPAEKKADKPAEIVAPTTSVIRCAAGTVLQPVPGKVIPMEEIPDETFASGVLGEGVGVVPTAGVVVAPFDGEVTSVFDTKHAITLEANGMELLIHVGINTVSMNGEGFTALVQDGDKVKAGQPLLNFDVSKIKAAGCNETVVVMLTNAEDLDGVSCGAK
ncbi:MAG: PTS glucose transporter subunit IIA [Oscillospiraceae bacterium]|nr:PTS glucose transporter subunit IIA [Oscillospiraceae bacterium]